LPRVAVLRLLEDAIKPLSHAEVCDALAAYGFNRATLYRVLMGLSESELLSRIDVGDHIWRFELRRSAHGRSRDHPHFVCTVCGNVSCLPGVRVRLVPTSPAERAISTGAVTIQFKGPCDRCTVASEDKETETGSGSA
jgi:Fur family ferric uptake transcriptional regulator